MTTYTATDASTLVNPNQSLPDDVEEAVRALGAARRAGFARRAEAEQAGRPTAEDRTAVTDVYASVGRSLGVDVDTARQALAGVRGRRAERMSAVGDVAADPLAPDVDLPPVLFDAPQPVDHSFWAASATIGGDGDFQRSFQPNGILFTGGIFHHSGNLRHAEFWASCVYAISPDRMPRSPSNRWRSTPHIELFGGVEAHTGDDDIFTGDLWSKCWMHRKQTLTQTGLGGTRIVGQREETQTLAFEEDHDRTVTWTSAGSVPR